MKPEKGESSCFHFEMVMEQRYQLMRMNGVQVVLSYSNLINMMSKQVLFTFSKDMHSNSRLKLVSEGKRRHEWLFAYRAIVVAFPLILFLLQLDGITLPIIITLQWSRTRPKSIDH